MNTTPSLLKNRLSKGRWLLASGFWPLLIIEQLKLMPKEMIGGLIEDVFREQRKAKALIRKIKSDG